MVWMPSLAAPGSGSTALDPKPDLSSDVELQVTVPQATTPVHRQSTGRHELSSPGSRITYHRRQESLQGGAITVVLCVVQHYRDISCPSLAWRAASSAIMARQSLRLLQQQLATAGAAFGVGCAPTPSGIAQSAYPCSLRPPPWWAQVGAAQVALGGRAGVHASCAAVSSTAAQHLLPSSTHPSQSGASATHAYHGSSGARGADDGGSDSAEAELLNHAFELRRMRQAAVEQHQQALQEQQQQQQHRRRRGGRASSGSRSELDQVVPEYAAKSAMRDPLGMLMAATGVPMGLSMRVVTDVEGRNGSSKLFEAGSELSAPGLQQLGLEGDEQPQVGSSSGADAGVDDSGGSEHSLARAHEAARRLAAAPPEAFEQLAQMMAAAGVGGGGGGDSWGTTQESAEQIARRIAESNRGEGADERGVL